MFHQKSKRKVFCSPHLTPIVNMLRRRFPCNQPINIIKPGRRKTIWLKKTLQDIYKSLTCFSCCWGTVCAMRPPSLSFPGASAWTLKVQVTHINKYFWKKQPWSTGTFHSHRCKYTHRARLTDYAKGEKSELLPKSVHVFLERSLGGLETSEHSWFSLLIMSNKMTLSPGGPTHSPGYHYRGPWGCPIYPSVYPPQIPSRVCWAQTAPAGRETLPQCTQDRQKVGEKEELYSIIPGELKTKG